MSHFKNLMEVFKLLDKSNCRKCNRQTCMAFAADVFTGKSPLSECPNLSAEVLETHGSGESAHRKRDEEFLSAMKDLQKQVEGLDLSQIQKCVGGQFANDTLTLTCLGKPVSIRKDGKIFTDIHVNPWIAIPLYNHLIHAKGTQPSGNWVPLRELPGGKDWFRLFGQRCEKPMKKIADTHTDFFEDLVRLFKGEKVEDHYESDISLVLHPFPTLPLLICYWKPEDEMDSELNLFFDDKAEDKLPINNIYTLCAGIVNMLEKIVKRHA